MPFMGIGRPPEAEAPRETSPAKGRFLLRPGTVGFFKEGLFFPNAYDKIIMSNMRNLSLQCACAPRQGHRPCVAPPAAAGRPATKEPCFFLARLRLRSPHLPTKTKGENT